MLDLYLLINWIGWVQINLSMNSHALYSQCTNVPVLQVFYVQGHRQALSVFMGSTHLTERILHMGCFLICLELQKFQMVMPLKQFLLYVTQDWTHYTARLWYGPLSLSAQWCMCWWKLCKTLCHHSAVSYLISPFTQPSTTGQSRTIKTKSVACQ